MKTTHLAILAFFAGASGLRAQNFTITFTDINPHASADSTAFAVSGTQQAGSEGSGGALWTTGSQYVNLNTFGFAPNSVIYGLTDTTQVGSMNTNGYTHASIWYGSGLGRTELNPAGAVYSAAYGVSGGQQVGYAQFMTGGAHAALWSGTAGSFTDLNPDGAATSVARATNGVQQAGYAGNHAALWAGTAASFTDLNPAGALLSAAYAITATLQGGYAYFDGNNHAALWSGTAASFIDLNPTGYTASIIRGMAGDFQVGTVYDSLNNANAALWWGSADNFINLQDLLGSGYVSSNATAVWTDGVTTYVVGYANPSDFGLHAMLWTITAVPEPAICGLSGAGLLAGIAFVRRRK